MLLAVPIDRLSVDVFEDQVGRPRRRDAGIDELRDVRMCQATEDGPFASEPLFGASRQRDVQELDRRPPFEAAVAPLREPDDAHATLADRRHQCVRADGVTGPQRLCQRWRRLLEEVFPLKRDLLVEQRLQIRRQRGVLLAEASQPVDATVRGHVEHLVEILADGVPPLGVELAHRLLRQWLLPQRPVKVDACLFPVALDGPLRDAAHRSNFGEREPAEESEVDDLREPRVDTREIVERIADLRELAFVRDGLGDFGAE